MDQVRIDKWLWAARCFKTRTQATEACDGGHVTMNGLPAKPARAVHPGDRVEVWVPGGFLRQLEVIGLGERRGTVEEAARLFIDHTPPPPPREEIVAPRDRGAGRPTKRDRRLIHRIFED